MTDPNAPQEGEQPYQPPQYQPPQSPGASYGPPASSYGPPAGDPYGAPPAGQYGVPPTGTPYQPVAPKKGGAGKIIGIVAAVVVVLLVVCGVGSYYVLKNNNTATKANEGDCLSGDAITGTQQTTTALKVVKCDATDARYKVIAKIPDKTQSEAVDALCQPYANKGAEVIYWQEKSVGAGVGNVLCLGPAKS
jgi:hypothetical protein